MVSQNDFEELEAWVCDRDKSRVLLQNLVEGAIESACVSDFFAIILSHIHWQDEVNKFAKGLITEAARDQREWSMREALMYFGPIYDLLGVDSKWIILNPACGRLLVALQEGKADSKFGGASGRLLSAVTRRIEAPPTLAWLRDPLRRMRSYDGHPLKLLKEYEDLHLRVKEIWRRHKHSTGQRNAALCREYPVLERALARKEYSAEYSPQYMALQIIAARNISDLKRDLARARKIHGIYLGIDSYDLPERLASRFSGRKAKAIANPPIPLEQTPAPASA